VVKAGDVMTRQVVTVTPETTIEEAAQLMLQHRISGLHLIDSNGAVLGILTEGDLLRLEIGTEKRHTRWIALLVVPDSLAQEYVRARARKVGEVMTNHVYCTGPDTPLSDVVALMETKEVKRLPVVQPEGLVGIISRADLMTVLVDLLSRKPVGAGTDTQIRNQTASEIDQQVSVPRGGVHEAETDGIVASDTTLDER
jgi:CBS domain-containing protein